MLHFEDSVKGIASASLAHLFMGLMKADGVISISEEILMEEMLLKKSNVPGDGPTIDKYIKHMVTDPDYKEWDAQKHYDQAFNVYQNMLDNEENKDEKIGTLLKMMDMLMKVDKILPPEQEYIANVAAYFRDKHGYTETN